MLCSRPIAAATSSVEPSRRKSGTPTSPSSRPKRLATHTEAREAMASAGRVRSVGGLIIRQTEPRNLETPFDQLESYLPPTELFYIRSHFTAPAVELASYQLRIDGAVRRPFSL